MIRPVKNYLVRIAISIDQLGGVLFFGHEDETISSRIGKAQERRGGKWPLWHPINIIRVPIELIDPGHFEKSIERSEPRSD